MDIKKIVSDAFNDIADSIERGAFAPQVTVGVTVLGSEHGVENVIEGARMAARSGTFNVVLIGTEVEDKPDNMICVPALTEEESHTIMEKMLDAGEIQACVTMHYNFPIGVSTVGRVITPGQGREMIISTTTGVSATDRTEAMFKNSIYGIISAKALGIKNPTVGILNVEGARAVERALRSLAENGYAINFGESKRSDGGVVMRGNDLLMGSTDVMVADSLTGNILMKMFSSYTTGGSYEALGYGYGIGVGFDLPGGCTFDKNVLIISRASGAPVISGALVYAAELVKGNVQKVIAEEVAKVKAAGWDEIVKGFQKAAAPAAAKDDFKAPEKEVVTGTLSGIEIMDLDDAVDALMRAGVYAESGMGCTGPMIMVNEAKLEAATEILTKAGYLN